MIGFLMQLVVQIILLIARLTVMAGYLLGIGAVQLIRFLWRTFREAPRKVMEAPGWPAPKARDEQPAPRPLLPKPWEQRPE
jgi:hypothetical protein